jgi:hypothetical protein
VEVVLHLTINFTLGVLGGRPLHKTFTVCPSTLHSLACQLIPLLYIREGPKLRHFLYSSKRRLLTLGAQVQSTTRSLGAVHCYHVCTWRHSIVSQWIFEWHSTCRHFPYCVTVTRNTLAVVDQLLGHAYQHAHCSTRTRHHHVQHKVFVALRPHDQRCLYFAPSCVGVCKIIQPRNALSPFSCPQDVASERYSEPIYITSYCRTVNFFHPHIYAQV